MTDREEPCDLGRYIRAQREIARLSLRHWPDDEGFGLLPEPGEGSPALAGRG